MLKPKKTVLDERELQEMYRIEHSGLWLLYALLCIAIVVQMLLGAPPVQMAGELVAVIVVSMTMIIAHARHGIWEADARPSVKGNARTSLMAGVGVGVLVLAMKRNAIVSICAAILMFSLCFLLLSALMACVCRRQRQQEEELENE